jgi:hypothetical protein
MSDLLTQKERRAWPRSSNGNRHGLPTCRLQAGRTAQILDVCSGGVLIETAWCLLPGMRVELHLGDAAALFTVRATVVRCQVNARNRDRILYRGALAFEDPLLFAS